MHRSVTMSKSAGHGWISSRPSLAVKLGAAASLLVPFLAFSPVLTQTRSNSDIHLSRLEQAATAISQDQLSKAEDLLKSVLANSPYDADALNLMGVVRAQQQNPQAAEGLFRRALAAVPAHIGASINLGELLLAMNRTSEALETLQGAHRLAPNRTEINLNLARLFANSGDYQQALKHLQLDLDPQFAAAFAYLGVTRVELGAYDEGVSLYEEALKVDPQLGVVHYLIAEALLKQAGSTPTKIESHLKRAVELDATFVSARLSLAKLYMRSLRWAEALAELQTAVELDPEVAEIYYQLSRVYVRLKRPEESRMAVETFKRLSETQKERERSELQEVTRRLSTVLF